MLDTLFNVGRFAHLSRLASRCLMPIGLLAVSAGLAACTVNPTTGRSQLNLLSREREIALGSEASPQLTEEYGGRVQDAQLQAYLEEVGQRMARHTEGENPSLPWEFTLLDSDVINAFALPGGKVFMSRGLAEKMTNEAQFAAVVGHEIGHVTARHINERMSRQMLVSGLMVGAAIGASQSDTEWIATAVPAIIGAGGQGYLLKFGRDQELESDALGVRYMVAEGWDPMGAVQVQQLLGETAEGGRPPEIMSTHPAPQTRVDRLQRIVTGEYAYTQNNADYTLGEERFNQRFLARLAKYIPPHGHEPTVTAVMWCGVCRERAEESASAEDALPVGAHEPGDLGS
ncbi:MAG: M48 family metallopeptidase [Planctomycetota bacterium]